MSKNTLYYLRPSHYCEKARAILTYKKIPFNLVNVPYGQHQEVITVSGQDYVPYIAIEGENGITWPNIPDWAETTQPQPTIYPGTDPQETRARSRLVEHWAHNVVEEYVWRYVLADMPKVFSDPQERWIFIELQERKRGSLELMGHRKMEFLAGVKEVCGLSQDLLGGKNFLINQNPSLADFALYGALHPLKLSGNEIPRELSNLRDWHSRMNSLVG
jgi:glutathione S-transferase